MTCDICGSEFTMYMVKDVVWKQEARLPYKHNRCPNCLSDRLGRPLRQTDFNEYPVNDWVRQSRRFR